MNQGEERLTGIDNNQDPLPPLVDLCELSMLGVKDRGVKVEVVLQSFVSLDDNGSLGILGDFGGKVRHVECAWYLASSGDKLLIVSNWNVWVGTINRVGTRTYNRIMIRKSKAGTSQAVYIP
jgi:hypothetical protein